MTIAIVTGTLFYTYLFTFKEDYPEESFATVWAGLFVLLGIILLMAIVGE